MEHTYQARVKFSFLDNCEESKNDSETFEVKADSPASAFKIAFGKVINNWDEGTIGITSVEIG